MTMLKIEIQPLTKLLVSLWFYVSTRRRTQFFLLLALMIFASFAEVLSIGAALPFLSALTSPEQVFQHPAAQPFVNFMGFTNANQLILPLTLAFGFSAIIAGVMRLILLWTSTRLSFAAGADLSISIYRRTLYQPYAVHINRNSSEIIDGISVKANTVIYNIILPMLMFFSSTIMLIAILFFIFIINPIIALWAFIGFGSIHAS